MTTGIFSSSNSNVRTITMGTGTWTIAGNNATIWTTAVTTNLTFNRGGAINANYSGAIGTRTIISDSSIGIGESVSPDFSITAGSDHISFSSSSAVRNLDFTGFSGTLDNTGFIVYGNLTASIGMTLSAGSNVLVLKGSSGTKMLTSNGKTFDFPVAVNASGATWQLADNLTLGSTQALTLTAGTFDANGHNVTVGAFNSNNTNTRALTMGIGIWTLVGNNATIFDISDTTGLTLTPGNAIKATYAGSVGTRTISTVGSFAQSTALSFDVSAGGDTVSLSGSYGGLDFTGFSGLLNTGSIILYGNLTIASTMTLNSLAGLNFWGASTTEIITSSGKTFNCGITFNGTNEIFQMADDLALGSTQMLTLVAGTFDANGHNVTTGLFSSSNSNTRTITMGIGTWTITGNNATVWNTSTITNMTLNKGNAVVFNYSGSIGTRNIQQGDSGSLSHNADFDISAGADIISFDAAGSIDFTGFLGTLSNASHTIYGNLTLSSGMTLSSGSSTTTFAGISGSYTITSAGKTMDFPVSFLAPGSTYQLDDDLTLGSTQILNITNGTFNANGHNVTVGRISFNPGTVILTMGIGTWTLEGTGTVWSAGSVTGLTINANTSTIDITDTSVTSKTFIGGGRSYNNLSITGSGTGQVIFTGANTFNNFTIGAPKTVTFPASTTTTFTGTFTCTGSAGNLITINSSSSGTQHTLSKASGTVSCDYLSLQDSNATGGAVWDAFASNGNTDNGNNTGWVFNSLPTLTSVTVSGSPAKGAGSLTFTSTASDPDVGDTITLYVCKANDFTGTACGAGGEWAHSSASSTNPSTTYAVQVSDVDGSHAYYASLVDNHGAQASANPIQGTFTTDQTSPRTTPTTTTHDGSYTLGTTSYEGVTLTLSCQDATSGCTATLYCTADTNTCTPATTYAAPLTFVANGTTYLRYQSTDAAGNTEATGSAQITIDSSAAPHTVVGQGLATSSRQVNLQTQNPSAPKLIPTVPLAPMPSQIPAPGPGTTTSDLISQILAKIAQLRQEIAAMQSGQGQAPQFTKDLRFGDTDPQVKLLQQWLNNHGYPVNPSTGGPGSPGHETDLYGYATMAAVAKLQQDHAADILTPAGLTQGNGFFGPSTRRWVVDH